jgi:hypothetical protein
MDHAPTHQQETMRQLNQVLPTTNLVTRAFRQRGPLDRRAVPRAIEQVFRRHGATRTTFHADGQARLHAEPVVGLHEVDLAGAGEASVAAAVEAAAETPFSLEELTLLRCWIFRLGPEEHLFLWQGHHVIADAVAYLTLLGDFVHHYLGEAFGQPVAPGPAPGSLADVAAWEHRHLATDEGKRQVAGLLERFRGELPVLALRDAPARAARPELAAGVERVTIAPEVGRALGAQAQAAGATLATLVHAVYQAMLRRWSGQDVVLTGMTVSQRAHLPDPLSVALAVNIVPTRTDLSDDPAFGVALGTARERAALLREDCRVPGGLIAEQLGRPLGRDQGALFQALFNYVDARWLQGNASAAVLGAAGGEARIGPLAMSFVELGHRLIPYDLYLTGGLDAERRLGFQLVHRLDRVSPGRAHAYARDLEEAFATVARAPETPVSRLCQP